MAPYNMDANMEILTLQWLDEMKQKGFIRPSDSAMTSPLFWVAKKVKTEFRPCQDYRHVNAGTIPNAYPLPTISDLLLRLRGQKYFTKFDVRWGYNNVRIKEGDEWKAAFSTPFGSYEPTVMFFGLCNSPATFQKMMNEYFWDFIMEGWVCIYMDDILIAAGTLQELRERTKRVLQRLLDCDLHLKLEKCLFEKTEIDFLGMIISHNQIRMDTSKLMGIKEWTPPTTVKQVRSFLGFCNFYRKFIGHYAEISKPLTELTKKTEAFVWTEERNQAFESLKEKFMEEPVLMMPDPTKQFILETDASKVACGAVLKQYHSDGELHPCGYISHTFTPTEKNYDVYDRELKAVIDAIDTWRQLLRGSPHPVIIHTDHKNLSFYKDARVMSGRQMRWCSKLMDYNLLWEHIPGNKNIQADALSRRPDHVQADIDEDDMIMPPLIPPERIIASVAIRSTLLDLHEKILDELPKDLFAKQIVDALKQKRTPFKSDLADWEQRDGLIFYQRRIYVPVPLWKEIVELYHNTPITGHPGVSKLTLLIQREYFWPGMTRFIKKFVQGCALCQQMKINTHPGRHPLQPIQSEVDAPFHQVTCDFITDLPLSNGFDTIMVVVDHGLSKGVIYSPCNKTIDAKGTAELYIKNVWKRFGFPKIFISDRDPRFSSKVFQEIAKTMGIKSRMSTAFHPQTDGETERVNQELEVYLRMFCATEPDQWNHYLPMAEFAHNSRVHDSIKQTPFNVILGSDPIGIPTVIPRFSAPAAEEKTKELIRIRQEALAAHELARQVMAQRRTKEPKKLGSGELVWLEMRNIKGPYETKKLAPKREGPFEVSEVLGKYTYRLQLPKTWRIHNVFDRSLLTPYVQTQEHGENFLRPPPDIIEGEEQYEIQNILRHRRKGRGYEYYVRWKGYSATEDEWVSGKDMENAEEILEEYKKRKNLP
jgi:hypothetical protein